jgi:hypothetical protein
MTEKVMEKQQDLGTTEKAVTVLSENGGVFGNVANFETAQRMAKALATSDLVPANYQGKLANCMIAMEMAARTRSSIFAVMQNLHIIKGRPSWSASFIAAAINSCGRFEPLRYEFVGKPGTDEYGCYAWTRDMEGNELKGPKVTIGMAKGEGWWSKKDRNGNETSKWQTMPELMMHYRAASFFGRLYAPEILMGMHSAEEIKDMGTVVDAEVSEGTASAQDVEKMFDVSTQNDSEPETVSDKTPEPEDKVQESFNETFPEKATEHEQPEDLKDRIAETKKAEQKKASEKAVEIPTKKRGQKDQNNKDADLFGDV